jgi:GTP-binding protein
MPKTTVAAKAAPPALAFGSIRYAASAAEIGQLPPDAGAEVAFVGRSNAGKSSAINAICGRRRLAFVSRTPGRTQMINFFDVEPGRSLVDLPGYGYAKVPAEIRGRWEALLSFYLLQRASLHGLIVIVDARHGLTDLDRHMLGWFAPTGKGIHVLLTKADKLARQQQTAALRTACKVVAAISGAATVQLFSSVTKAGVEEARAIITRMLGAHMAEASG